MKKLGLASSALFTMISVFGLSGCGGSSGGATGATITAVDGYVKNANLTDASGQVATYSATGGKYVFASTPTYPLTLTGGLYEDTNTSFDINMTCASGTVISPITTFLDGNSALLGKLANLSLTGNPGTLSEFSVDYIDTNDSDLAKLSQLLYVIQSDSNLTTKLRKDFNATSLTALYSQIQSDINTTITDTAQQNNMRVLVQKIKDINSTQAVDSYETILRNYKTNLATISWKGKTYGQIISPFTGKVWLDRNLGASRVATAFDDNQSYGDHYQWGRDADGHQESNSTTSTTLATDINATNASGNFILASLIYPYDWTSADLNGSLRTTAWSKTDGSSICPLGYRVPSINELTAETTTASTAVTNRADAFNNFLKLPSAGHRDYSDGILYSQGNAGNLWSSSVSAGSFSQSLGFGLSYAATGAAFRASGASVRCLRD